MDSINVDKIQALRKYKEQQLVNNLLFYPLATLAFGLFCTSPFWFSSLYGSTKTLVCVSIPRVLSLFFSAKSLFILGNLIVFFLLRDSKVRPSYNNNNSDSLGKPILPKSRSKKVNMHAVSPKKSQVIQPLDTLCHDEIERDSTKQLPGTNIEEVKMHATFLHANKMAVPQGLPKRTTFVDYIDSTVEHINEEMRRNLTPLEDRVGKEAGKELALLQVKEKRRENGRETKTRVVEKKRGNMQKERGGLMVLPSPNDELKKRADDFIAMVNMQIRLEADDEDMLLDAC